MIHSRRAVVRLRVRGDEAAVGSVTVILISTRDPDSLELGDGLVLIGLDFFAHRLQVHRLVNDVVVVGRYRVRHREVEVLLGVLQ